MDGCSLYHTLVTSDCAADGNIVPLYLDIIFLSHHLLITVITPCFVKKKKNLKTQFLVGFLADNNDPFSVNTRTDVLLSNSQSHIISTSPQPPSVRGLFNHLLPLDGLCLNHEGFLPLIQVKKIWNISVFHFVNLNSFGHWNKCLIHITSSNPKNLFFSIVWSFQYLDFNNRNQRKHVFFKEKLD